TTDERIATARARLRAALQLGLVPDWLVQAAQQSLIDLDCALAGGLSDAQSRMLLAQVDALITVVGAPSGSTDSGDADAQWTRGARERAAQRADAALADGVRRAHPAHDRSDRAGAVLVDDRPRFRRRRRCRRETAARRM